MPGEAHWMGVSGKLSTSENDPRVYMDSKHPSTTLERLLVAAETLAARYAVAPKTIRKWGREGFFPTIKISHRCVRYPLEDCDAIMASRRVGTIDEARKA